jgi:hypothetical protein
MKANYHYGNLKQHCLFEVCLTPEVQKIVDCTFIKPDVYDLEKKICSTSEKKPSENSYQRLGLSLRKKPKNNEET